MAVYERCCLKAGHVFVGKTTCGRILCMISGKAFRSHQLNKIQSSVSHLSGSAARSKEWVWLFSKWETTHDNRAQPELLGLSLANCLSFHLITSITVE